MVASGHVEVSQGERVLTANTLTYNERTKTVSASGDVALMDQSGNIVFANYMEVTDDLKDGVIKNIKVLLNDKSRIAAVQANRKGTTDEFNKGVYSPCRPCVDKPNSMSPPIWQLAARRMVHDNDEHEIVYHDAWMEIFGVPVIFTPYFSMPDPSVKRRSGFLTPVHRPVDQPRVPVSAALFLGHRAGQGSDDHADDQQQGPARPHRRIPPAAGRREDHGGFRRNRHQPLELPEQQRRHDSR